MKLRVREVSTIRDIYLWCDSQMFLGVTIRSSDYSIGTNFENHPT